jgi:hypothetical protein
MHHIFLGGLSQYYYQNGSLVNDPNVPFVKTISRLAQGPDGVYHEYVLSNEMPALLGASAEFIAQENLSFYAGEILDLAAFTQDSIRVGHIVGGIKSTQLNPFTVNNTSSTSSNAVVYEVWLKRTGTSAIEVLPTPSALNVTLFPNPAKDVAYLDFELEQKANVECFILDANGRLVHEVYYEKIKNAKKTLDFKQQGLSTGNYTIQLIFNDQHTLTKKLQIQ